MNRKTPAFRENRIHRPCTWIVESKGQGRFTFCAVAEGGFCPLKNAPRLSPALCPCQTSPLFCFHSLVGVLRCLNGCVDRQPARRYGVACSMDNIFHPHKVSCKLLQRSSAYTSEQSQPLRGLSTRRGGGGLLSVSVLLNKFNTASKKDKTQRGVGFVVSRSTHGRTGVVNVCLPIFSSACCTPADESVKKKKHGTKTPACSSPSPC